MDYHKKNKTPVAIISIPRLIGIGKHVQRSKRETSRSKDANIQI